MSPPIKNGIMIVLGVGCGLGLSATPWMLARKEQASAARTVEAAKADEARMVRDQTEEARLGTELGKEEILRSQGYRRAGEVALPR